MLSKKKKDWQMYGMDSWREITNGVFLLAEEI